MKKTFGITKKAVAYYRVSGKRQEKSGLGKDAQKKMVHDFVKSWGIKLIGEYEETRSGMKGDSATLSEALTDCLKKGATLLIAKLDRLKRNVAFIAKLMESRVPFLVVEQPYAEEFTLHILAAVAQKEGRDISKRTKDALAAAKRRGTELGKFGRYVLSKRNKERADRFARNMKPIIARFKKDGVCTVRAIRDALNEAKVPTFHKGGHWHVNTVYNVMRRLNYKSTD